MLGVFFVLFSNVLCVAVTVHILRQKEVKFPFFFLKEEHSYAKSLGQLSETHQVRGNC